MKTMGIRIVLVSNVIFEPYLRTYISKKFSASVSDIQLTCVPFEELDEKRDELQRAEIIVVCLNFDELYPNVLTDIASKKISLDDITKDSIKRSQEIYSLLKECSNAKVLWFGFEDYYINNDIYMRCCSGVKQIG